MFSLCRLCAACTDPIELITEVTELEPKLVHCFGWRRSEKEMEMPKKACNLCADRVQRTYDFVECMLMAEKQLNKLLSEQFQTDVEEFLPQTIEIKLEDIKKRVTNVPESDELELIGECNLNDVNKNDATKYDDEDADGDDGIFGEPIDYSNDDDDESGANGGENDNKNKNLPKKVVKRRSRKKTPTSEPLLDALDTEDRLANGQISANGVQKLEKLFPSMKTVSWDDCKYKCDKCDRSFVGSINFYSHIRSVHMEEVLTIVVPCFYCDSKHRREFQLNRHIATEHFPHLKFR